MYNYSENITTKNCKHYIIAVDNEYSGSIYQTELAH